MGHRRTYHQHLRRPPQRRVSRAFEVPCPRSIPRVRRRSSPDEHEYCFLTTRAHKIEGVVQIVPRNRMLNQLNVILLGQKSMIDHMVYTSNHNCHLVSKMPGIIRQDMGQFRALWVSGCEEGSPDIQGGVSRRPESGPISHQNDVSWKWNQW